MKTIKLSDIVLNEIQGYIETTQLLKSAENKHDYETITHLRDERDSIARKITELIIVRL